MVLARQGCAFCWACRMAFWGVRVALLSRRQHQEIWQYIGRDNDMPKIFDSAIFFMAFMLINETKQEIPSVISEEFFAHG
jgi:hypothetical protein